MQDFSHSDALPVSFLISPHASFLSEFLQVGFFPDHEVQYVFFLAHVLLLLVLP